MKKANLRIACVDSRSWYSPCLLESLENLSANITAFIYLPKSKKNQLKGNQSTEDAEKSYYSRSYVWSTYTYPFDIFKRAVLDRVSLVHIQWELNGFGSFYASILLPLLLLFLRIGNKKSILTIHSVIPRFSFGLKLPGFTLPRGARVFVQSGFILLYRLVSVLSDGIVVHGKSLRILLCNNYKVTSSKVSIIPYGVPVCSTVATSSFSAILSGNAELVLAIGAVSPRKGLDTLINAFKEVSREHPSWILVIAGCVPRYYKQYYLQLTELGKDLIKKKSLIFLGEFSPQDTDILMEKSKVVIFPYLYNFGASSTLTFALQHRKVVIISALDFAKDLLTDGKDALLVPPENTELLVHAIERAMSDEGLRSSIVTGIDALLQRTSWDFAATKTMAVYRKILSIR